MRRLLPSLLLWPIVACSNGSSTPADAGPDTGADAGVVGLLLAPGEVAELAIADGVAGEQLATPTGNERFALVVGSTRFDGNKTEVAYSVATDGAQSAGPSTVLTGCAISDDKWKNAPLPSETPPTGTAVMVGATRKLDMSKSVGAETIDLQAIAVGKTAVVWADVTPAHPANLDMTFVQQFLADFDDRIMPRERVTFGIESDLDMDGHIGLVFTPLTKQTAVAFFTGCDLQQQLGCPAYNAGEYLYLTPPANIDPPYNTPDAIKETLAHELSHLIHYNRKVLRNAATSWSDSGYMIEGVGGFGQDVIGYQAGNLYVAKAGLDGINQFSLAETLLDRRPYDTKRDGVLRGGSYWFVRWLYDRGGGDVSQQDGSIKATGGPQLLRELMDAKPSMAKQIPTSSGSAIEDVAMDFYTTLVTSNRDSIGGPAPKNPCFAFLPIQMDPLTMRQRGGNTYSSFHGMALAGMTLQKTADGKILPGGAEYVQLDATAGAATIDLTVTVAASALPRVRVARIR